VKERYQDIEQNTATLRELMERMPKLAKEFQDMFEMSWIYHDAALEGVVYLPPELDAALGRVKKVPGEAQMMPVLLDIRNQREAIRFVREEAERTGRKHAQITLTTIKRIHDLTTGNTPEAQAARAAIERREKTEKELAKERDRVGYRKDMPLHRTYFHEIAQPPKIQPMLEKLVDYTGSAEFREDHPLRQAGTLQHMFLQIFPFTENSGKVGRLLSNLVLLRNGFEPVIIHSIDRQRYYESFRSSAGSFRNLLLDAMDNSLDNGIKFFREAERKARMRA